MSRWWLPVAVIGIHIAIIASAFATMTWISFESGATLTESQSIVMDTCQWILRAMFPSLVGTFVGIAATKF